MSYNMIDLTMFDKIDCSAETHYHRTFAERQKYKIYNINISGPFTVTLSLNHETKEANLSKFAELVVTKQCSIIFNNLYGSVALDKFYKGLEVAVGQYYIVEIEDNDIYLTAKEKGKVPNIITPSVDIDMCNNINFSIKTVTAGKDTSIFVPTSKRNIVHIPITTQGPNYSPPTIGDRLIFVDSVESGKDKTFTREVTGVELNAKCTCDIIELDQDIDRIESNHNRLDGLGLYRPGQNINNYTARFNNVAVYKRKHNYQDILYTRGSQTNTCAIKIHDVFGMKEKSKIIINDYLSTSENPHLKRKMSYFGTIIPWTDYKELLQPIYDKYGSILCDDLFLLTSNKFRPEYLVHIDYDLYYPDHPVTGSFTWPVLNCDNNTLTVWYNCYYNNQQIFEYGKQGTVIADPAIDMVEIDRYEFNSDTFNGVIFKHNDWHTLYNSANNESNRMLLQWRFKHDVSWDTIVEITNELHC